MEKLAITQQVVRDLLTRENFYNEVPEYFFLKEAGAKIVAAMDDEGGCSSCIENNLIQPTISAFISHTVNMRLDCGEGAMLNFKKFIRELAKKPDLEITIFYKEHDEAEATELFL